MGDHGDFYHENICLVALYGEGSPSYTDKGWYTGGSFETNWIREGIDWGQIEGIGSNSLSEPQMEGSLNNIGFKINKGEVGTEMLKKILVTEESGESIPILQNLLGQPPIFILGSVFFPSLKGPLGT